MATPISIFDWEIPWREEPGRIQSIRLQRVGHNLATKQQDLKELSEHDWCLQDSNIQHNISLQQAHNACLFHKLKTVTSFNPASIAQNIFPYSPFRLLLAQAYRSQETNKQNPSNQTSLINLRPNQNSCWPGLQVLASSVFVSRDLLLNVPCGPVVRSWRFHCWGLSSIPGQGVKIPQGVWPGQQKEKVLSKEFGSVILVIFKWLCKILL